MQTKRISDLLSLSIQVYALSTNERFLSDIGKLLRAAKRKISRLTENADPDKQAALYVVCERASQVAAALERKVEEAREKLHNRDAARYDANIKELSDSMQKLTSELASLEERLSRLEGDSK